MTNVRNSSIEISSESEDELIQKQKVWSKGDSCLAPFSGDGKFYLAHIKKLCRGHNSKEFQALVKFDEYGSDENEEVWVSKLKTPKRKCNKKNINATRTDDSPNTSMFKPLSGNEETSRLERKFENEDSDDSMPDTHTGKGKLSEWKVSLPGQKQTPPSKKKKKSAVVTGGGRKTKGKVASAKRDAGFHDSQEPSTSTGRSTEKVNLKQESIKKKNTFYKQDTVDSEILGFTEEDMEKPKFSFTPSAAKVPFVLSERGDNPALQVPATINQYLRDYQREGIKFLYSHYKQGRGAILGDDMGLGKTVQVIGLLAALLHKQGNRVDIMRQKPKFIRKLSDTPDVLMNTKFKPFLIIGPGSVLYNWLDELETWGYFTASKFHGADKKTCLADLNKGKLEVVVTTFETFRDNLSDLNSVDWEAVFVDEVHRIKGLRAQTTQALRSLHTEKRYGLTGTVLQNNMTELWSILDWAQPGVLGSLTQFETDFVQVIEHGQRRDATKRELALARKKREELSRKRLSMMIRRTKKLIADQLPEKEDNVVFCKLTPFQESVYRAVLGHRDMSLVLRMDDPCDCESQRKRSKCCYKVLPDGSNITSVMFSFMHLLLKTANHVALLTLHANSSDQQRKRTKDVCAVAFKDHPQFLEQTREASFRTLSDPKFCGKMKVLQGMLSVFYKSHSKVLVFSYSTRLLDILEQYVISNGHEFRRIDGSVNNRRRMEIVREFNKDRNIFVCLISTKAGGLGLNLTGANKVIIFDPNWNPSHDLQAQDRAYRIGQRKNVAVYRLISVGTIEENIYLRQLYKQQLDNVAVSNEDAKRFFHGIQGDRVRKGELFGIKNMFQLQTGNSCLTMDILERNEKAEAGLKRYPMSKYLAPSCVSDDQDSKEKDSSDDEGDVATDQQSDEESEDALRHLLGTDEDSGLDVASPPPSPQERRTKTSSKKQTEKTKQEKTTSANDKAQQGPCTSTLVSINSVFEKCGVMHVHENRKVVGSSRAEEHMSRCAIQEVYELHQNSQVPAMEVNPYSESSEEEMEPIPAVHKKRVGRGQGCKQKPKPDHNTPRTVEHNATRILIGQTPVGIRRQHFSKMADSDERDQLSLAEEVVRGNTETRLCLLRDFYTRQFPGLKEVITHSLTEVKDETGEKQNSSIKQGKTSSKKAQNQMFSKKRGRPRKAKQGLSFMNYNDSESQSLHEARPVQVSLDKQESDLSSLEIGKKGQGMTTRTRTPRGRQRPTQTQSVVKQSVADVDSLFDTVPSRIDRLLNKPTSKKTDLEPELNFSEDVFMKKHDRVAHDVDTLLFEIGQVSKNRIEVSDKPDHSDTSILDDIFSSNHQKRKPAPPKGKKAAYSCDLFSPKPSTSLSDMASPKRKPGPKSSDSSDLFSPKSSTSESDLTTDILNESTLVDDSIDCFSEHKKWKKRKTSPAKSQVNRLLKESNDDFEKLLETGLLRKKSPRTGSKISLFKDDGTASPKDKLQANSESASLFS